ncbi:Phytochelatin synthase, partial [Dimargaris cristalligena]
TTTTTTTTTAPTSPPLALPRKTFYRRELPPLLTAFTSAKGRALFKESLLQGTAEGYFNLAGNFTTQSEPAYCGPSSLAMVLNALEIDPGQTWKGSWRWYSDELIKTCASPEVVQRTGITFDQFECMAVNHCDITARRGDQVSRAQFRRDIREVCSGTHQFMVVSFARKTLQQTGDGHFSPIGAYHAATDSVLVLDTARFKYPSYFVSVDTLYDAMQPLDKTTGRPRGYFLIRAL